MELDDTAQIITYEEYHPFGTTAYQAKSANIKAAAKRYRYTGMERDEETGLEYHSARYYLPWLGRWLSADPIGIEDGVNVYGYCKGNPSNYQDKNGLQVNRSEKQPSNLLELKYAILNFKDTDKSITQPVSETTNTKYNTSKWSISVGNNLSTSKQQQSSVNHKTLILSKNQVFYNTNIKHPFGNPLTGKNDITEGNHFIQIMRRIGKSDFQKGLTIYKEKTESNSVGFGFEAPTHFHLTGLKNLSLFASKNNNLKVELGVGTGAGVVFGIPRIYGKNLEEKYRPIGVSASVMAKIDITFYKKVGVFVAITATHTKTDKQNTPIGIQDGKLYDSIGLKGGFTLKF